MFVGTRGGGGFEKRLVEQADVTIDAYAEVLAGPVVGVNPLRATSSILKMGAGVAQSLAILRKYRPQALLLTGGWANVPLAAAAYLLRVPMLVYLPDIEPGRTIQLLAYTADKIATTVPESAQYFREGQTVTTGYPLRDAVTSATRDAAIAHFGLDPMCKTLLVTGGSRGARSINIAVGDILPELLATSDDVQVIHVTGRLDYERTQQQVQAVRNHPRYHLFDYLESERMGKAFAAADIIIGRAGASVLGEFPYFGAASILVPYPYAWRYQKTNADWLAGRGAAIRMDDERMADELLPTLHELLTDDERLQHMHDCAQTLDTRDGAQRIAREWLALAGEAHDD